MIQAFVAANAILQRTALALPRGRGFFFFGRVTMRRIGLNMHARYEDERRRKARNVMLALAGCLAIAIVTLFAAVVSADHLQDLRDAERLGLPYASHWTVKAKISNGPGNPVVSGGFTFDWHYGRLQAGHRFLPSIYYPPVITGTGASMYIAQHITPFADQLRAISDQRLPLCLRGENLGAFAYNGRYTIGVGEWTKDNTPKIWHYDAAGVPQDDAVIDPLAPLDAGAIESARNATARYQMALYTACPTPGRVLLLWNGEEAGDGYANYTVAARPFHTFKPLADIARRSQRAADLVASYPVGTPGDQLQVEFARRNARLYRAWLRGLAAGMPDAWQGEFRTAAYGNLTDPKNLYAPRLGFAELGYAPDAIRYDGALPQRYGTGVTVDYTSPTHAAVASWRAAFNWLRTRNPRFVPGISVQLGSTGALIGPRTGAHEALTPERYAGFVTWLAWTLHEPGVPFEIRYYEDSTSLRTDKLFTAAADVADLARFNLSSLASLTKEECCEPVFAAVDRICETPTLRDFWLRGDPVIVGGPCPADSMVKKYGYGPMPSPDDTSPDRRWRVLPCSLNDPASLWGWIAATQRISGVLKVYTAAARIGEDILIFAWSPCLLPDSVSVTVPGAGDFAVTIDDPRGTYTVVRRAASFQYVTERVN